MLRASECRAKARASLKGRWGLGVGAWVVATLLGGTYYATAYLNLISSSQTDSTGTIETDPMAGVILLFVLFYMIALGIIGTATRIGYIKFNLNLTQQKPVKFSDIFWGYSVFGKSFLLMLISSVFYIIFGIALGVILGVVVVQWIVGAMSVEMGILIIVVFTIIVTIPLTIYMYRIFFAPNLIAENPNLKAFEALKLSNKLMKGNVWRFFCLNMSFIGWNLLSSLTFYIGYLWVGPYFEAAAAVFYRDLTNDNILKNQSQLNYMVNPQREIAFEETTSFAMDEMEAEARMENDEL